MTITSSHNRKLKEIRKLRMRKRWRERAGRFVAEGEDLLHAADAAGWSAVERYCAQGSGLGGVEVEPELLASASGIASGTRALAVYDERWLPQPVGPLCVYLHRVQDPGNVGSILRSAEAFGASCVAIGKGAADPFSPKAVRASMGAIFAVPVARAETLETLPGRKLALVPNRGVPLADAAAEGELTLMIGAEREGLGEEALRAADQVVHIPIKTDSLNAAMAATVVLYELAHRISDR
jgi:TrmH family RNA methyltransferase